MAVDTGLVANARAVWTNSATASISGNALIQLAVKSR